MNFAQMLMMDVNPQPPTRPAQGKGGSHERNTEVAVGKHVEKTQEAYKAVMAEWSKTKVIQDKLGLAGGSVFATLTRYKQYGLVEQRPWMNLPYNKRRGWEWRWVKGETS
jgi:hypothetical protein